MKRGKRTHFQVSDIPSADEEEFDTFNRQLNRPASDGMKKTSTEPVMSGRILKGVGGNYLVLQDDGREVTATLRGILRKEKITPYPGDLVDVSFTDDETIQYNIDCVHERRSFLIRPAIANLDRMIITCSVCAPKPDCFLLDKMIILCKKAGIAPLLCITKADLDPEGADSLAENYRKTGIPVYIVGESGPFKEGVEAMKKVIKGEMVSFAGQSGVGKSTLLNKILKTAHMDTGAVSKKIGRGKHTTRHSRIFPYDEGFLADTPGFGSLELEDLQVSGEDVLAGYPEIAQSEGACRFTGCRHVGELGCAVDEKDIDPERLYRYREFRQKMDKNQTYDTKKSKSF